MGPLKQQLLWIHGCHDLDELNVALSQGPEHYNENWRVKRHAYRTPSVVGREYHQPAAAAA